MMIVTQKRGIPAPACLRCCQSHCWCCHTPGGAGQKTNSLGTPSWPGLQLTPDLTSRHSAPCSVTHVPVELCSLSTPGLYLGEHHDRSDVTVNAHLIRHPRPPAHSPASLAKPPHLSPN